MLTEFFVVSIFLISEDLCYEMIFKNFFCELLRMILHELTQPTFSIVKVEHFFI